MSERREIWDAETCAWGAQRFMCAGNTRKREAALASCNLGTIWLDAESPERNLRNGLPVGRVWHLARRLSQK